MLNIVIAAAEPTCNFQSQIAEFLMSGTMATLSQTVTQAAGNIGGYAAGIAGSGIALYSVMWVVAFASGTQNGDLVTFIKWLARAMLLIAIAGTASIYSEYVVDTFWSTPAEVAQYIASSGMTNSDVTYDAAGKLNIVTALDEASTQGVCAGINIWKSTSSWDISKSLGFFLTGLVIIVGVVIFVAIAAGLAFVGFASLAVVLALGPLFIVAGIWDATKPMMESWLRTAINYALYGVVLMVIVGLGIGLVQQFGADDLGSLGADGLDDLSKVVSLGIRSLMVFAVATALLFKADDISASLVGGISLGAMGTLARGASGALAPAKAATKVAKAASNPAKTVGDFMGGSWHKDPRTGRTGYKGPIESARDHASALTHTRAKNKVTKG